MLSLNISMVSEYGEKTFEFMLCLQYTYNGDKIAIDVACGVI